MASVCLQVLLMFDVIGCWRFQRGEASGPKILNIKGLSQTEVGGVWADCKTFIQDEKQRVYVLPWLWLIVERKGRSLNLFLYPLPSIGSYSG